MKLDPGHPLQEIGECWACMLVSYDRETCIEVLAIIAAIIVQFSVESTEEKYAFINELAEQIKAEIDEEEAFLQREYEKTVELGRKDAEKDG